MKPSASHPLSGRPAEGVMYLIELNLLSAPPEKEPCEHERTCTSLGRT
jgi:hypothetical protein